MNPSRTSLLQKSILIYLLSQGAEKKLIHIARKFSVHRESVSRSIYNLKIKGMVEKVELVGWRLTEHGQNEASEALDSIEIKIKRINQQNAKLYNVFTIVKQQ